MVLIARTEADAYALAAPAYERWLKSFRFLYDLNALQTPPNLPLTACFANSRTPFSLNPGQ